MAEHEKNLNNGKTRFESRVDFDHFFNLILQSVLQFTESKWKIDYFQHNSDNLVK